LHDFRRPVAASAKYSQVVAEPEERHQIGELRGARAAQPGSAYHEKITADHSRLRPIRLDCSRPDSARRHQGAICTGFVNKVAISDMFEIQSSQLALSKQADADTKPFAEKMVQDHQKTSSELKGLVEGSMVKLTLPTSLDSEQQNMLNELNAKSGKDFDQTYDQIQVKAHREAVALFEAYSKSGEDSELKTWAGKMLPHLKEHLSMAEKLK
jgi:putative membrane protein